MSWLTASSFSLLVVVVTLALLVDGIVLAFGESVLLGSVVGDDGAEDSRGVVLGNGANDL